MGQRRRDFDVELAEVMRGGYSMNSLRYNNYRMVNGARGVRRKSRRWKLKLMDGGGFKKRELNVTWMGLMHVT